jgi:signal transduction histidine kinase
MGTVRIDRLAREVCDFLAPLADSAGVALDYRVPDSPILIEGDASRIKQLIVNLLDNAIKYTPAGGEVRLELKVENDNAVLAVADTGRGIPGDALPRVFERFYRQSDPRDLRAGGFGLGLAISKWIVDAHRGSIEVCSTPGTGSKFTTRLPLAKKV